MADCSNFFLIIIFIIISFQISRENVIKYHFFTFNKPARLCNYDNAGLKPTTQKGTINVADVLQKKELVVQLLRG